MPENELFLGEKRSKKNSDKKTVIAEETRGNNI